MFCQAGFGYVSIIIISSRSCGEIGVILQSPVVAEQT
jgi:hypothetical protein